MFTVHLITETVQLAPMAAGDDGILDLATAKLQEFRTLALVGSGVFAVFFTLLAYFKSRGAMAATIIAGFTGALLVWLVNNVTDVSDRVDNEINSAPVAVAEPPSTTS